VPKFLVRVERRIIWVKDVEIEAEHEGDAASLVYDDELHLALPDAAFEEDDRFTRVRHVERIDG
jgi:hypothetical protein